jgi:hypothetical protein
MTERVREREREAWVDAASLLLGARDLKPSLFPSLLLQQAKICSGKMKKSSSFSIPGRRATTSVAGREAVEWSSWWVLSTLQRKMHPALISDQPRHKEGWDEDPSPLEIPQPI